MSYKNNSRREFLRKLSYLAAGGSTAAMIPQLRMMGTALASTNFTDYRALVCIYLSGGNDAWNLVVPFDTPRYNTYATARSGVYTTSGANPNPGGLGLALPTGGGITAQKIIDGNDQSSTTNQYFMHPSVPELVKLYNLGNLGLVINAGTLVRPITKTEYNNTPSSRPPQLFSHSDQENLWHQANTSSTAVQGWGGRCGDFLRPNNTQSSLSCISIAGANRFEVGLSTVPYQVSSGGLAGLASMCNPSPCTNGVSTTSVRDTALKGLLAESYANDFQSEYGKVFQRGRDLYNLLSDGLGKVKLNTNFTFNPSNQLALQLQMVAKMIKLSIANGYAQRQIFYVRTGGFDLHAGMMSGNGNHGQLLQQLSQAMNAFNTSMGPTDVNAYSQVTTFTASEFARTLQSNGSGSDHGWGGVQMVMGGAVHGGKLYTNGGGSISGFPDQTLTATNNFSRGQMIPGIGVEQYAATMAAWMGVSTTDINTTFPNLVNFSSHNLGFV